MSRPEISVLIVSHGHTDYVRNCLTSLPAGLDDISHEIIVVDNINDPEFSTMMHSEFPTALLLSNDDRMGFGANTNKAARAATGEILLVLNPDTSYASGSFRDAIDFLNQDPKRGVVAASLLNMDDTPQGNFRGFPSLLITALRGFGASSKWKNPPIFYREAMHLGRTFDRPAKVDWAYGSFMMMRRTVFEQIGGFDEAYFMYYEDVDLCFRLRRHGFETWAFPDLKFYHDHIRTSSEATFSKHRQYHVTSLLRYAWHAKSFIRRPSFATDPDEDPQSVPMLTVPASRQDQPSVSKYKALLGFLCVQVLAVLCAQFVSAQIDKALGAPAFVFIMFLTILICAQFILKEMQTRNLGDVGSRVKGVAESAILATVLTYSFATIFEPSSVNGASSLVFFALAFMLLVASTYVFSTFSPSIGVRIGLVTSTLEPSQELRTPELPLGLQTITHPFFEDEGRLSNAAGRISAAIANQEIDAVYIVASEATGDEVLILLRKLSMFDVPIWFSRVGGAKSNDVMRLRSILRSRTREALKYGLDLVLCLSVLPLLLILFLVISILIYIEDPGPVFFKQFRGGRNQVPFGMLKFRSMYVDQSDFSADKLTTKDDPRVTRIGNILRRTSLDEIPQLINVIKGEMSIVGPRPLPPNFHYEGHKFEDSVPDWHLRSRVKPGLTGLSQLMGLRGTPESLEDAKTMMEDRAIYDNIYIDRWSIWLDLRIIIMTGLSGAFMAKAY